MSQRDHELTASPTVDNAPSVPASPPPRDSMEDADPSLTRKRPRLDSGAVDDSAMHVDEDSTRPSPVPAEQQVEMTIRSQPPSSHPPAVAHAAAAAAAGTPCHGIQTPMATYAASNALGDGAADSPPVIAIDDDDDDDDDAASMVSYPAVHVQFDPELHLSAFPFMNHGDYVYAAAEIAKYFQSSMLPSSPQLPRLLTRFQTNSWMAMSSVRLPNG